MFHRLIGLLSRQPRSTGRRSGDCTQSVAVLNLEQLEPREVPALVWTTYGEGKQVGQTDMIDVGIANRGEMSTQPIDFHGASAQLASLRQYDVVLSYDLATWDSYNPDTGSGTGYWDSFSASITSVPYPQLNVLQDPLQFPFLYGGNSWTDGVLERSSGYKSISAAFNVAGPKYINFVLDTKTTPTADDRYPSWGTFKLISGDLAIVQANGTDLPDSLEQTQGGYVPVNNDNDNYNFSSGNTPILDKDEAGPVVGESDLVPMRLHQLNQPGEGGQYKLVWNSSNIRIWKNPDKTGAVTSDVTTFNPAQDSTVYVEGVSTSAGRAKEEVQLKWVKGAFEGVLQRVRLTVYEVDGVSNVPGYSAYTYQATIPGGGTGSWTATGGTVQSGGSTNTATILWGGGPFVATANFSPVAGFTVKREVNVVLVDIEATAGANNSIVMTNPPVQPIPGSAFINSGGGGHTMTVNLRVNRIEGPTVNGGMRGVRFIEMGFLQNVRFTEKHGDYNGFSPGKRLTSSLENGTYYLDGDSPSAGTQPWYDKLTLSGATGYYAPGSDPAFAITNVNLNTYDTPQQYGTESNKFTLTINGASDQVDLLSLIFDANLYFGVRTTEAVYSSEKTYTQRARVSWRFDGSGIIDAAGVWTGTGTGNTASANFLTVVTDGSVVPVTTGPVANNVATLPDEPYILKNK